MGEKSQEVKSSSSAGNSQKIMLRVENPSPWSKNKLFKHMAVNARRNS